MRVYGLKNCDTCRQAVKDLNAAGIEHVFVDVREDGVKLHQIENWLEAVGAEVLVNKRSTTWRALSSDEQAEAMGETGASLLATHPTLIKRPVIENRGAVHVGWTAAVKDALLP